jgi:hypothetical protein
MGENPNLESGSGLPAPGEAAFSLVGEERPQVVFQVRERSAVIKYFGDTRVEVRGGMFPEGGVTVTAVVFRVGRYYQREYVTWWDYHRPAGSEIFQAMTVQEFLSFYFYGDNGRRDRTFVTVNPLGEFFAGALVAMGKKPPWSAEEFEAARLRVCVRFSGPCGMWEAVGQGDGG